MLRITRHSGNQDFPSLSLDPSLSQLSKSHHQSVSTHLELVGRVEGNLADLLVAPANAHDIAQRQFHALEECSLGGVAGDLALQDRLALLAGLKLGSVAEGRDLGERFEARRRPVVLHARLVLGRVGLDDLIVEPHVGHGHPVLRQGAGFVRADGRRRAQRLDGLEILHEAVLRGHALGRQGQTDGDGGEQALGHVGDDDADEEDDGVEPVVAEDEGDDEEGDAKEDGHTGDQVDEVMDLLGDGGLAGVETRGQTGDPAHGRLVAAADDDALGRALDRVRREEGEILGLEGILIREFGRPRLGLGLARQRAVVNLGGTEEEPGLLVTEQLVGWWR